MAPTKITQVKVSAASVMAGAPLEVRVYGTGQQKYCGTSIVIDQLTPQVKNNYGDMSSKYQYETGGWPRIATFTITEVGTYQVRLLINVGNQNAINCGYQGEGSISGDLSKFEVVPPVAK